MPRVRFLAAVRQFALAAIVAATARAAPVALTNPSFESGRNLGSGLFGDGELEDTGGINTLTGWTVIATDNTSASPHNNNKEVAVGWGNLTPADPAAGASPTPQALSLMSGAAIAQATAIPWSSLSAGQILTLTIAVGDRNNNNNPPTNTPRWSDESFFGLSDGLAGRGGAPNDGQGGPLDPNWITGIVARTPAVATPPGGFKSGTMGDLILTHTVTAADLARGGNIGVFIASIGNRDATSLGLSYNYFQSFYDHVRLDLSASTDSDNDGLPDSWENLYFGSPTAADPAANPDHDGLTNLQEFQRGTHPVNPDTDGDTLSDGAEVNGTLNPWNSGVLGTPPGTPTDPLKADSDNDGFRDDFEIANATDPNNLASPPRPNIVFIIADDLGWTDLRTGPSGPNVLAGINHGSDFYQTPNLSRLADQGLSFTHCYSCINCSPTRAAMLSGQYAPRSGNGVYLVDPLYRPDYTPVLQSPSQNQDVPASTATYAETLKARGYVTAHFGKWHVGGHEGGSGTLPLAQGFDFNYGGTSAGVPNSYYASSQAYAGNVGPELDAWAGNYTQSYLDTILKGPAAGPLHQRATVPNYPDLILNNSTHGNNKHLTDAMGDAGTAFIQNHLAGPNGGKPFLLQFNFYAPHEPIEPRHDLKVKYQGLPGGTYHRNASYAALVESMDQTLGRLLDRLDDPNGDGNTADSIAANTLVVFTSDNGGVETYTDNAPLRFRKGSFFEGGIRVPLIVRRPGTVPAGQQTATLVHSVDFYPTLVAHAGATMPAGPFFDGTSFDAHLRSPAASPRDRAPVFWHFPGYIDNRGRPCGVVVKRIGGKDYKLIYNYDTQYVGNNPPPEGLKVLTTPWELYNLTDDLSETNNLADGRYSNHLLHGAIADELASDLHAWLTQATPDWSPKQPTYRSDGTAVPLAPASVPDVTVPFAQAFRVTSVATGPGPDQVTLTWNSEAGFRYDIEASSDLTNWQSLATAITAAAATTTRTVTDPQQPGDGRRFYRVRLRA